MTIHRQFVQGVQIDIAERRVLRLLGGRRGRKLPRPALVAAIQEACRQAEELIDPRGIIGFCHDGLPGAHGLAATGPLALAVCTIGPGLEEAAHELATQGQISEALILDAVGSVAAEAFADQINGLICALVAATDLEPQPRCSPGYPGWPLEDQRALFDALVPAEIGVTLTEGCMMVPRKSVSFGIQLTTSAAGREQRTAHRCTRCGLATCRLRGQPLGHGAAEAPSVWEALFGGVDSASNDFTLFDEE